MKHASEAQLLNTAAYVTRSAVIDPTGQFRYSLIREWEGGSGTCLFVMLNPSTADRFQDDPTVRKCMGFARRWGFAGLEIVNLCAYRATCPHALFLASNPVGQDNDRHIAEAAWRAARVVAGWGAHGAAFPWRVKRVRQIIPTLHCLGVTRTGQPRHPLYLPSDQPLQLWDGLVYPVNGVVREVL